MPSRSRRVAVRSSSIGQNSHCAAALFPPESYTRCTRLAASAPSAISSGEIAFGATMSGFEVEVNTLTAPTSVQWFAFSADFTPNGTAPYLGGGEFTYGPASACMNNGWSSCLQQEEEKPWLRRHGLRSRHHPRAFVSTPAGFRVAWIGRDDSAAVWAVESRIFRRYESARANEQTFFCANGFLLSHDSRLRAATRLVRDDNLKANLKRQQRH